MARTMMIENKINDSFLKEVVHIVVDIHNRFFLRPHENKIPYELWFGRKTIVKYFKIFGSKCYIRNTKSLDIGRSRDDIARENLSRICI